jgi:hypothetical protein
MVQTKRFYRVLWREPDAKGEIPRSFGNHPKEGLCSIDGPFKEIVSPISEGRGALGKKERQIYVKEHYL